MLICCGLFLYCFINSAPDHKEMEVYFNAIKKVIAITQEAAQKAIAQSMSYPTRSATTPSQEKIAETIVQAIEVEIESIKENSELTAEQKEILKLLEQYLAQYQVYTAFAPQIAGTN